MSVDGRCDTESPLLPAELSVGAAARAGSRLLRNSNRLCWSGAGLADSTYNNGCTTPTAYPPALPRPRQAPSSTRSLGKSEQHSLFSYRLEGRF